MPNDNYVKIADKYANDIINGKITASKYIIKAAQRYKQWQSRKDIYMNESQANFLCLFAELHPHIKGVEGGRLFKLQPWQAFIFVNINGWRWVNTDLRVIKQAYIQVARKNGKSFIASILGNYMTMGDNEPGAEVFCVATGTDQAREVWDVASNMIKMTNNTEPGDPLYEQYKEMGFNHYSIKGGIFTNQYGVDMSARNIYVENTFSLFTFKHSRSERLDGLNAHCVIVDELHAHKDGGRLYNVMEESMAARKQPLLFVITTAGNILDGICVSVAKYNKQVLDGNIKDDGQFALIYELDKESEWNQPKYWIKANPNYGISVNKEYMINKISKAEFDPLIKNEFLTKHCNIFVQTVEAYFHQEKLDNMPNDNMSLNECIDNKYVGYMGIDLAQKNDLCAVGVLFDRGEDYDGARYKAFVQNFIPESLLKIRHNYTIHYRKWVGDGYITTTPGEITDYEYIYDYIAEIITEGNIDFIGYDPYHARELHTRLIDLHPNAHAVPQNARHLSEPQKKIGASVISQKLDINGDLCLKWQMSNVFAEQRRDQTILFTKESKDSPRKIDGVIALSIAFFGEYYMQEINSQHVDMSDPTVWA